MTFRNHSFILISVIFIFSILLVSCNTHNETRQVTKTIDTCGCTDKILTPPPLPNTTVFADSLFVKDENKSYLFSVKLIADKTVDMGGEDLQIFRIKAENIFSRKDFYFAFPTKFNHYWNDVTISKNRHKNTFNIGYKDSSFFHSFYSISIDTLPFNKGLIVINSKSEKLSFDSK